MPRQFKFRGWHPEANRMFDFKFDRFSFFSTDISKKPLKYIEVNGYSMIDPNSIPDPKDYPKVYLNAGRIEKPNSPFPINLLHIDIDDPKLVIMQYLENYHDKNGKEVCEGDILKYDDMFIEVSFNGIQFMFTSKNTTRHFNFYLNAPKFEVVGNIYQNLELLGISELS